MEYPSFGLFGVPVIESLSQPLAKALQSIYRSLDLLHDELLQLSPKELAFLLILEEAGECRVKDLASKVKLPLSTVSWTADKMVNNGLIARKTDPKDRRAIILSLSDPGRKALVKHKEIFEGIAKVVIGNLSEKEAKSVVLLINKITTFFN